MAATRSSETSDAKKPQDPAASQSENPSTSNATAEESKPAPSNAPLAPPPKPNASGDDYFNGAHNAGNNNNNNNNNSNTQRAASASSNAGNANNANGGSHFSLEPNPFEQSFGNPSAETPGKFGGLPSVASLTSPAPLGPGGTPNWQNSLRSGPLSPAMLPGPTGGSDYFNQEFRGSFPTPNESSLRTGLTPGGGGSMFPAPSPNSQAIFNSMQSGGATPGTIDFHRTAMNAAARSKVEQPAGSKSEYQPAGQNAAAPTDPFQNQPESDAVNSLYMLANTDTRNANQFAVPEQPQSNLNQSRIGSQDLGHSRDSKHGSIGSVGTADTFDNSDDQEKATRSNKSKKNGGGGNSRRKAEDPAGKAPPNKKGKANSGKPKPEEFDSEDDEKFDASMGGSGSGKSKMTDEEKRKNFLERNRVAALKCRQRKKQWLAGLQTKVEILQSENEALSAQSRSLRDEVVNLKTLLMAHKDCAISHQQGLGGNAMAQVIGSDFNPHMQYGHMGLNGQGMMGMQGQGMQRR